MPKESTQTKLSRVRPPRVQISYEVQVGDAIKLKELPFVLGVLGDFTGDPVEPLRQVAERKFVDVNPDNFDEVLRKMGPHLAYSVENKLAGKPDAPKLKVDVAFESLDDFSPERVARKIEPLKELLELRTKLADLRGTLQTDRKLDDLLQDVINNSDKMQRLRTEIGGNAPEGPSHE